MEVTCKNPKCGETFEQRRRDHVFCSRRCNWTHHNAVVATTPEAIAAKLESGHRYRERNREKLKARYVTRRIARPEQRRIIDRVSEARRKSALRQQVIARLGGKCVRCGFSDWRAMQVDHVNGGGKQERRMVGRSSYWKQVMETPAGVYQLLCANCNQIKRYEQGEGVGLRTTPTGHKRKY